MMHLTTNIQGKNFQVDIENPLSIAIPIQFNGPQPNHFSAPIATKESLQGGDFIGDTKRGGSCNVDQITLVAHCNGTHTESIHHIVDQEINIGSVLNNSLASCLVISLTPVSAKNVDENYIPTLENDDQIISLAMLQQACESNSLDSIEALVIRTLPNNSDKKSAQYGNQWHPPFFTQEAMTWIAQSSIKHLLVDFPSVDKMYDDGHLTNHHIFWNVEADSHQINELSRTDRTITEMIFVDDSISDGLYCLNLQFPSFEIDAAPSRPLLYPLIEID